MSEKLKKKKPVISQKSKPFKVDGLKNKSVYIPHWAIYAVLLFTAMVYVKALFNGFANYDDDFYIIDNAYLKNFNFEAVKAIFSSFYQGNYHPLTTLTYLFEYHLFGLNPLPYHTLNVLLHLVNVLLVYRMTEKLSGNKLTALIVALLFAVHPMHVESVAWVSERKDVLYTMFYIGALIAYLNYIDSKNRFKFYFFSFVLFIFSLLSKSAAVTLPVLMLAVDIYKGRKLNITLLLEKVPFLLLSVLFGILALYSQQEAITNISTVFSYSFIDRIFLFSYTLFFYVFKLIAPFNLSVMHFFPDTHGSALPWVYYLSLPVVLILIWLIVRPSKFRREMLFGVFFFLIVISIMLQIISVGSSIVAERYTYISYIGLFYILGQWIAGIQKESFRKSVLIVLTVLTFIFSLLAFKRIGVWSDGVTLFTDVVNNYPEYFQAYQIRGNFKKIKKDYKGALDDYNKSIQLNPGNAVCLNSRGEILNKFDDYKSALRDFNLSILLDSSVADVYCNRGLMHERLGGTVLAMRDYDKAIKLNSKLQIAYKNRSALNAKMGKSSEAINDINMAIKLDSTDAESYSNRGNIKAMQGQFKESIADYNYAIKLKINDDKVFINLALSKLNLNDTIGACVDLHKAQELGNTNAGQAIKQFCK